MKRMWIVVVHVQPVLMDQAVQLTQIAKAIIVMRELAHLHVVFH
jgi:hypothetical protein